LLKEFKDFIMRGNVLDLAVAVIIGGAFGKIVSSLVNDMLMPLIGLLMGRVNFAELAWNVGAASVKWGGIRANHHRLCHRRLYHLPDHQSCQPDEETCTRSRADHEGMPALLLDHQHQSHALSELHIATLVNQ
jgi:Large-conductance mechanosensitive channel, MscL